MTDEADPTTLPVTLSSDFGRYYPAAMRGVLLGRGVDAVHDVTHELPRQDVEQSAFWLRELLPYFPPSVHCVVVDPGVGSDRRVLAVRAGGHVLVGPDNGVLWPAARRIDPGDVAAYAFAHVEPASRTFHGRDVFAPLAAAVANLGVAGVVDLPGLEPADDPVTVDLPRPTVTPDRIEATVVAIDGFGNAITNVAGERGPVSMGATVAVDGRSVPVRPFYGAVAPDEALVTVGSHGHVELAVNGGSGADRFDLAVGDHVVIAR